MKPKGIVEMLELVFQEILLSDLVNRGQSGMPERDLPFERFINKERLPNPTSSIYGDKLGLVLIV